jgi:hypothetical protein
MNIKKSEKTMKENCLCECGNKKVIRHFEECKKCGSTAYHSTPKKLNEEKKEKQNEKEKV